MSKLEQIHFQNYKGFKDLQEISLKPITVVFGKNSSGKSSILKLLSMISHAISEGTNSEFSLTPTEGVSLGTRFHDLFHNHILSGLKLELQYDDVKLSSDMLINDGEFSVYHYNVTKGEKTVEKVIGQDLPTSLFDEDSLNVLNINGKELFFDTNYIGPIRVQAPSNIAFSSASKTTKVGFQGENTYGMLLNSYLKKDGLFDNVSAWMKENLEDQELVMDAVNPSSGLYSLMINRNGVLVNVADVGQGISQLLPIITASFINYSKNTFVEIEQPALHLHPAAHANIAYRLASSAIELGTRYVIESHSENFLLGLRKMVADKDSPFTSDDVVIYYIHSEKVPFSIEEIHITPDGDLTSWPTGVFAEGFELMDEITDLQS